MKFRTDGAIKRKFLNFRRVFGEATVEAIFVQIQQMKDQTTKSLFPFDLLYFLPLIFPMLLKGYLMVYEGEGREAAFL